VAKASGNYGQRVQNSVFECVVDPTQWARLRLRMLDLYDPAEDTLRFYFLGSKWRHRVEHHGAKAAVDLEGRRGAALLWWPPLRNSDGLHRDRCVEGAG